MSATATQAIPGKDVVARLSTLDRCLALWVGPAMVAGLGLGSPLWLGRRWFGDGRDSDQVPAGRPTAATRASRP